MEILNKTIEQIRKQYGVAGGILIAIKDGKVLLKECFGKADAEKGKPVDSKTLFQIASCSKAFTTMVAGQLCDEGKMTWDTPVKQLMPDFRMVDKYAEEHVTPRDMACHRTGLCRHDVMRTFVREDRADLVRRIAYFPPAYGFREKYSYQNQMYVALGYLCERLTGKTWEQLLKEKIGDPLGMDMYFRGIDTIEDKNAAMPYAQKDGKIFRVDEVVGKASNPCGGLYTNLDSLERWIRMLLGEGELEGKRIISKEGFAELIKPNVVIPGKPSHPKEMQQSYAMAWINSIYKGKLLISHSGSTNGFNSMVGFFPEENAAFALSVNTVDTPAYSCLKYLLCDLLLNDVEEDYSFLIDIYNRRVNLGPDYTKEEQKDLPLSEEQAKKYLGTYYNPGYGVMEFVYEDGHLRQHYGLMDQPFNYIGDDKFVGFEVLDTRTYRANFTEDGNLWMRLSTDAVCPIFFERVR